MNNFVYVYSPDENTAYEVADRLVLARVPKERIRERDAYEFFVRVESNGDVVWSRDIADRGAVFSNPGAVCRSHVTYSPALKRYLLIMIGPDIDGRTRLQGGLACTMLPSHGDHGQQLFTPTPGTLGRVNRPLFRPSGSPPTDDRHGLSFPVTIVFRYDAPRLSWCRTGKRNGFRSSPETATDHRDISAAFQESMESA